MQTMNLLASTALKGSAVSLAQVAELVAQACPANDYGGKKVLLIVPDATRTAPVGLMFQTLFKQIGAVTPAVLAEKIRPLIQELNRS